MSADRPNRLHSDHDGTNIGVPLGEVHSVGPHGPDGVSVWFKYGARADFTVADMRRICREAVTVLATMPRNGYLTDCSGAVADLEAGE